MIGKSATLIVALLVFSAPSIVLGQRSDEERVGRPAAAQVLGAARLVESAAAQRYVNAVGYSVAQNSGAHYKWHFGLVASDSVNAFAMPGGYILLTTGLARLLASEDDLAYVLAHEVAHVVRRHHYQVIQRQALAEQAATNLQAVAKDDEMAKLSLASGQIYARGLDKTAEFESDRLAVDYMSKAGYDPAAALGVLERLQHFKGHDQRTELLFSTHPSPTDRFGALVDAGIDQLPRQETKPNANRERRFKAFRDAI